MSTTASTVRCDRCGLPVEVTRAALAAGLNHPACVLPARLRASLTASAGADGPGTFVLARWAARIAHSAAQRRSRTDQRQPRQAITASAPLKLPRRPQPIASSIRAADHLLRIAERAGVGSAPESVQREARKTFGREATARAWSTLTVHGALRVSPALRLSSPTISRIDAERWAAARPDLIARARKAQP
jgi:hypothetical protein